MNNEFYKKIMVVIFPFLVSLSLLAKPDVSFIDSADYDNGYLGHVIQGDDIRFVLHGNVHQIYNGVIPELFNEAYNLEDLKSYFNGPGVIFVNNDELKEELKRMLTESFNSNFKAKEFLDAVLLVLRGFKERLSRAEVFIYIL